MAECLICHIGFPEPKEEDSLRVEKGMVFDHSSDSWAGVCPSCRAKILAKPGDARVALRPDEMRQIEADWKVRAEAAEAEVKKLRGGLTKISAIRDSIVGFQNVGWSEHIYPLVAALHDVGFDGVGYDEARKETRTLLDRAEAAEALADRLAVALKEIAVDWWPPTHKSGICKECGEWTPARHPEAHDHAENCTADAEYRRRADKRMLARNALNEWRKARGKDKA